MMVLIWLYKVCKRGKLLKNKIGLPLLPDTNRVENLSKCWEQALLLFRWCNILDKVQKTALVCQKENFCWFCNLGTKRQRGGSTGDNIFGKYGILWHGWGYGQQVIWGWFAMILHVCHLFQLPWWSAEKRRLRLIPFLAENSTCQKVSEDRRRKLTRLHSNITIRFNHLHPNLPTNDIYIYGHS